MYHPLKLRGIQQPSALLYIDTRSYPPGADAVLFFCNQILPHVWRAIGKFQVWIVGADPPPEVTKLSGDSVRVTGWEQEVLPYYRRSSACIVPLKAGACTRLKILELMALGRPVISTTIGCEDLDDVDGRQTLVADGLEQFARKIVHLFRNSAMYQRVIAKARQLVVSTYC